ncbi:MAG: SPOR domain-containing protein [Gammaproteobacteria bacterium]|nr:SPOR domain-containing protein [Gammaproteobacteria bacterium]
MPKKAINNPAEPEFVLKHRIAGAAFLIFFGALFLPWVLGPPNAAERPPVHSVSAIIEDSTNEVIERENDVLEALEQAAEQAPEQVYISKITPLSQSASANASADQSVTDAAGGDAVDSARGTGDATAEGSNRTTPAVNTEVSTQTTPDQPEAESGRGNNSAVAAADVVEVGWAVQVGIYTNSSGVAKVLADLRAKGFRPSTTVVDTNRGKGTGTRVWLGPFAERVEAAKVKTQLTEKTGEAGFIRAYP